MEQVGIAGEVLNHAQARPQSVDGEVAPGLEVFEVLHELLAHVGLIFEWRVKTIDQQDCGRTRFAVEIAQICENTWSQRERLVCGLSRTGRRRGRLKREGNDVL